MVDNLYLQSPLIEASRGQRAVPTLDPSISEGPYDVVMERPPIVTLSDLSSKIEALEARVKVLEDEKKPGQRFLQKQKLD